MKHEENTLLTVSLRRRGHEIIDEIVELGWNKRKIYRKLYNRLGRPRDETHHFSKMHRDKDLYRAIYHLRQIRDNILYPPNTNKRRPTKLLKPKSAYNESLDKIREIGEINAKNAEKEQKWYKLAVNKTRLWFRKLL